MDEELATEWSTERIKEEVIDALANHSVSWKDAGKDDIRINEISGLGGNRTFHVINNNNNSSNNGTEEVCLHLIGKNNTVNHHPYGISRVNDATAAFANGKIGPKRITEGFDKFIINEWVPNSGELTKEKMDEKTAANLGNLLARVHQIDKSWYTNRHHKELVEEYPEFSTVPQGSNFWYLTTRNWPLVFKKEHASTMECWLETLSRFHCEFTENEVKPVTKAGQNIVTTHGDFHLGNILCVDAHMNSDECDEEEVSRRMMVVDLESTQVSFAIQDIS